MTNLARVTALLVGALVTSCSSRDRSADTDQAGEALHQAQSKVSAKHDEVASTADDIERRKRALASEQQQVVDRQKALDEGRRQLGSARATLTDARKAYAAAVSERFAKLDADLARLATRTDAAGKDATTGLAARRDALAVKLAAMPAGVDDTWAAYTTELDTTFDAIERDLGAALAR